MLQEDESDASADELAAEQTTAKRTRHAALVSETNVRCYASHGSTLINQATEL